VPPFYPAPSLRARHNGWSPRRQADFLGLLAETGSVKAACERVGMSREAAYKLRRRAGGESFAAAWDAALGAPARKITHADLDPTAGSGPIRVTMVDGRYLGMAQESDDSAYLAMLDRWDRITANRVDSGVHISRGFASGLS
jgi:hypothetical protein